MKTAKLTCQESFGNNVIKTLEIKNVGDCDALNIRLNLPHEIELWNCNGLFPFPKLESGRRIEVPYIHNLILKSNQIPPYVELKFYFTDEEGEKEYHFYLTT